MSTTVEPASAAPRSEPATGGRLALAAAPLVLAALVLVAVFVGSGSSAGRLWWTGAAFVVGAAASAAGWLTGVLPRPRLGRWGIVALVSFVLLSVWAGASLGWSLAPDRSWIFFNHSLVYLAALLVSVALGARRRSLEGFASALAAALTVVLVAALATKVIPALDPDLNALGANARLKTPIGYANALALIGVFLLPLALALAVEPGRRVSLRAGAVVAAYLAWVAIPLTYSRSGVVIAAAVTVVWLARGGRGFGGLTALAPALVPAAIVGVLAFLLPGVTDESAARSLRDRDGAIFGLALVVGALAVFALARALLVRSDLVSADRRRIAIRLSVAGAAVALVAACAAAVVVAGGPRSLVVDRWHEFRGRTPVEQSAERLATVSSNYRLSWWREALEGVRARPLAGSGGGTFALVHERYRRDPSLTTEPHSLPLQLASELGVVGLALGGVMVAAAWLALRRRLRDTGPGERTLALALVLVPLAWLLQSLVDFPWEHPAVTIIAVLVTGLLIAGPGRKGRREPLLALAVTVLSLAALYSLAAPWLAERKVDQAYAALEQDPAAALSLAEDARRFDPTSLTVVYAQALAADQLGDRALAHSLYRHATEMQPENADAWWSLGQYELSRLDDPCSAYESFNLSYLYDSQGPAGIPGGWLDQTKAIRARGGCG
jgi:hypothetical protein